MARAVLPAKAMSTVPRIGAPPTPSPSYRREKWLFGLGLGLCTLVLAGVGGVALGGKLTHQPAQARQPDGTRSPSGTFMTGFTSRTVGPGVVFDPAAFPKEQFSYSAPPAAETTGETPEGDGTVINEVGVGEPVDLLGGTADPGTADGESGAPDIFFGQDAPAEEGSGERDLFDLGAKEPGDQTVDEPTGEPAEDPATPSEPEHFTLSLGSFESRANADQLVSSLSGHGVSASVSEQTKADGTVVFRVYGGSFDSRESGQQKIADLRAAGIDAWLVKG